MIMIVWRERGMTELAEHGWLSEREVEPDKSLFRNKKQIVFVPLTHTASLCYISCVSCCPW